MSYNPFSLKGKTILITGASSGIGKSVAIESARLGANVIITARNEERLKETLQLLGEGKHQYIVADISNNKGIESLVSQLPNIDGLVNNAGLDIMGLVSFIKESDLDTIININLKAPVLLTHLIVKKKKINKGGSIVFTSSIAKNTPNMGNSMYSSTKGGVCSFMRNAALELAARDIRCNAVLPGLIDTPLKTGYSTITQEQWEKNKELYPLKCYGNPSDVAFGIIYFLSDVSRWVTGSELIIDGGRSLK